MREKVAEGWIRGTINIIEHFCLTLPVITCKSGARIT